MAEVAMPGGPAAAVARGTHLILRDSEGSQKVFWLGAGCQELRMGRYLPLPVDSVLGVPYGATLRRNEAGEWRRHSLTTSELSEAAAAEAGDEAYEHNANLAQDNRAQALSPDEVRELKGRCTGEEVVKELASNSATFASKTKFAQEKYLRKKSQKHVQQVTLMRPTVMDLCETYMKQSRAKACGLRFDYLSNILCQADVRTGGRYLVLDSACGLVVAAMAQQLCGAGQVYRMFRGGCPDKALNELDLGARRSVVRLVNLEAWQSADPWSHEWLRPPAEAEPAAVPAEDQARFAARQQRWKQRCGDLRDLQARPVDSLIVVAGDEEAELSAEALDAGLDRLASGGRVVVYGQNLQPLAARQGAFRSSGKFVDVRLHQLFTREYQVLPMRTHPIMTAEMMLCEGFILSATKVESEDGHEGDEATGEQGSSRKRRRRG